VGILAAALVGAAGSILGGIVGGWIALVAGSRQSRRDLASRRDERSQQAALSIAAAVGQLEEAIVGWQADADGRAIGTAYNRFSQTAVVQGIALTDAELADRVTAHVQLAGRFAGLADRPDIAGPLAEPTRRHANALLDSLAAHVGQGPLPPYEAPPLNDALALLSWNCPS
jgi:hypothetical protein